MSTEPVPDPGTPGAAPAAPQWPAPGYQAQADPQPFPDHYPDPPAPPGAETPHPPQYYWEPHQQAQAWHPADLVQFRKVPTWGWLSALWIAVLGGVVSFFFNQHGNYLAAILETAPFALMGLLAYVGRKHVWALVLAGLTLALMLFGAFVITVMFTWLALAAKAGMLASGQPRFGGGGANFGLVGNVVLWCVGGWAAAMVVALPPVRRVLARFLPLDPESPVHAIGLATVVPLTLIGFGQLIALGGRPPLLTMIQHSPDTFKTGIEDIVAGMVLSFLWMLPCALVAVGWPLARSFREALERVGWVRPSGKQVLIGIGAAVAMVVVFQGLDFALGVLWQWTRWPKTDAEAFERLLKPLITPQGAILIGLTAGIGEEVVVRGVLQPRFGIVLSNLFFVSLHAFQYGFDGLLSVFAAGLVLGILRARTNTTTSAITHGTYDFILVLMSWYMSGQG